MSVLKDFYLSRIATLVYFWQTQNFALSDLKNLFTWGYWTETGLDPFSADYIFAITGLVIFLVLLVIWRAKVKKQELIAPVHQAAINQISNVIVFVIVIAVSYIFFRTESISYLSSRLVLLVAGVVVAGWLGWTGYYQTRIAPVKAREYLERERFFRYIPTNKAKDKSRKSK